MTVIIEMFCRTLQAQRFIEQANELLKQHRHLAREMSGDSLPSTTELWSLQRCRDEINGGIYKSLIEFLHKPTVSAPVKKEIARTLTKIDNELGRQVSWQLIDPSVLAIERLLNNPKLYEQRAVIETTATTRGEQND